MEASLDVCTFPIIEKVSFENRRGGCAIYHPGDTRTVCLSLVFAFVSPRRKGSGTLAGKAVHGENAVSTKAMLLVGRCDLSTPVHCVLMWAAVAVIPGRKQTGCLSRRAK